jgi:O-antigen ligase
MTLLDRSATVTVTRTGTGDDSVPRAPRSADATTILAFFVVLQLVLPSRLVMNYLPLSLSAASLVALLLGTLWMCTQLTTTLGAAKGRNPVRTMLFGYAFVLLASYTSSAFSYLPQDERALGDHSMVTVFALIFVGLALCDGVRSRERVYFLVHVIVFCGTVVATVGVLQYLVGWDLTPLLRPPGMHFVSFDSSLSNRAGLLRAAGTASNPLEFGVLCAMVLPLAIHVAYRAKAAGRRHRFWWSCVGLLGGGIMFSASRSAIVGLAAAGIVLFIGWSAQRRKRMAIAGLGFLVVIKFASPGLLRTMFDLFRYANQDDSVQWRTHDYQTARQLISQHLLLGRGIGTWYAPKHEVFDNEYLLTLVSSGVIGLASLLAIFLAAVYAALRVLHLGPRLADEGDPARDDRDLMLSLTAALVVIFPAFATFDFMAFPMVGALAFLLAGTAGAMLRIRRAEVAGEPVDVHAVV